jgi:predicted DNA-binding transcriptional regulator AlpA
MERHPAPAARVPLPLQIPATGYLRLPQIIGSRKSNPPTPAIIPVSKSTWWAGVRSGRYPKPTRALGERITAWRVEDIRALIESAASASS